MPRYVLQMLDNWYGPDDWRPIGAPAKVDAADSAAALAMIEHVGLKDGVTYLIEITGPERTTRTGPFIAPALPAAA